MAVAGILASHYTVVTVDHTGTASVAVAGILGSHWPVTILLLLLTVQVPPLWQ